MRVITGKARGIQLKTPDGMLTRPTADRVKEALFSIIQFEIPNAAVLDLFGGSGSTMLAAEQLNRIAYIMELDPKYATVIVERFHLEYPDQEITVLRDGQTVPYDSIVTGS